jgi:hypothetical protein
LSVYGILVSPRLTPSQVSKQKPRFIEKEKEKKSSHQQHDENGCVKNPGGKNYIKTSGKSYRLSGPSPPV